MLFTGKGSVRMVKNCDLGLKNAALGLRPRAVFSRPRSRFFTIRTSQPANNIYILYYPIHYCIVLRCMCNNFTYFSIKNYYKMSYSRVWKRLENFFSFQFKINARTMLCHPFMTGFLIGRQSALTSFYFHYLKILSYLWLCPCFGFFLQLKLSFLL